MLCLEPVPSKRTFRQLCNDLAGVQGALHARRDWFPPVRVCREIFRRSWRWGSSDRGYFPARTSSHRKSMFQPRTGLPSNLAPRHSQLNGCGSCAWPCPRGPHTRAPRPAVGGRRRRGSLRLTCGFTARQPPTRTGAVPAGLGKLCPQMIWLRSRASPGVTGRDPAPRAPGTFPHTDSEHTVLSSNRGPGPGVDKALLHAMPTHTFFPGAGNPRWAPTELLISCRQALHDRQQPLRGPVLAVKTRSRRHCTQGSGPLASPAWRPPGLVRRRPGSRRTPLQPAA